jgi:hypothetical protein
MNDATGLKTISCESGLHFMESSREPIFHTVGHDGSHGLATLDVIKLWTRQVITNGYDFDVYYAELYAGMPNEPKLLRCNLGFAGTDKKPKLIVTIDKDQDGWLAGVLWTSDL